jgi:hypothetical protein
VRLYLLLCQEEGTTEEDLRLLKALCDLKRPRSRRPLILALSLSSAALALASLAWFLA